MNLARFDFRVASILRQGPILFVCLLLGLPVGRAESDATNYVVFASRKYKVAAKRLSTYRSAQGLKTSVMWLEDCQIDNSYAKTRSRIQATVRAKLGAVGDTPKYLVLLGDVPDTRPGQALNAKNIGIPCFYEQDPDQKLYKSATGKPDIATDHFYALADDADGLEDYCVGRLPARSVTDAEQMINNIVRYETKADFGPWRRRLNVFAGEGGFGAADKVLELAFTQLADKGLPYDFDLSMTYAKQHSAYGLPPWLLSKQIINECQRGSLLLAYFGHGLDQRLDNVRYQGKRYPILDVNDLRAELPNLKQSPILLLIACYTGRLDRPDASDCLSERLIKAAGGPVAIVSASRISHPYPNTLLSTDFMNAVCQTRVATVGEAMRLAKRSLMTSKTKMRRRFDLLARLFLGRQERKDLKARHLSMYNLFGDPALKLATPDPISLTWKKTGAGRTLNIGLPGQKSGKVLVQLTASRRTLVKPTLKQWPENLRDKINESLVLKSYHNANDKVVRSWEFELENGVLKSSTGETFSLASLSVDQSCPRLGADFYIKVYAWGEDWAGSGAIEAESQPRKWRTEPPELVVPKRN